ncbi:MAG: hypothetical protein ACTSRK_11750 [Promethearchaeota archaeon]
MAENSFDFVPIKRNPECRACADPKTPFYLSENYERDSTQCDVIP